MLSDIQLIECPRDAMQGWPTQIDTSKKIEYLKALMQVGFDTLDCVSFVSPKAIPQMADSHEVIRAVESTSTSSRLLAIVANERGAADACVYHHITDIGYPFSISPTFQHRNANSSIEESYERLKQIAERVHRSNKQLVVYISMAFGNPYDDEYSNDLVIDWIDKLNRLNVNVFSLADTVGVATAGQVSSLTTAVIREYPNLQIGVHLHSSPHGSVSKLEAAYHAGCTRFDAAIGGFGGCPMAGNDLVGNMNTQLVYEWMKAQTANINLDETALAKAIQIASEIFI